MSRVESYRPERDWALWRDAESHRQHRAAIPASLPLPAPRLPHQLQLFFPVDTLLTCSSPHASSARPASPGSQHHDPLRQVRSGGALPVAVALELGFLAWRARATSPQVPADAMPSDAPVHAAPAGKSGVTAEFEEPAWQARSPNLHGHFL
eukprot:2185817-Rhodomonas_salina.2